jgi:hypothetical protein
MKKRLVSFFREAAARAGGADLVLFFGQMAMRSARGQSALSFRLIVLF